MTGPAAAEGTTAVAAIGTRRPPLLDLAGRPRFLLGVNYWSRAGGPRMWERFAADRVRAELAQLHRIGLNTCRSFAFIPSLMPQRGRIDPAVLRRMALFFDLCREQEIFTIPTLLVGHMSGENYDFVGQAGRDLYTDDELLGWQCEIASTIARLGAGHPAVVAYLASNEMPYWAGAAHAQTVRDWAGRLKAAVRSADRRRPFGLGDGVMNLDGGDNGFNVDRLRDLVDFFGPHTYLADSDPLRQALNAETRLRSLSYLGLPVLFEEFGCSSCQVAEDHQALYYRELLFACLTTGAAGALAWCFSDFDLVDEAPYRHHAFELGFGITRADGSEKPVCDELRRFSALLDRIDFSRFETPTPRAAIVVPSYFNRRYPFSAEERPRMRRTLLQAYLLCTAAGLETELVPEEADLSGYALLLAPATQKLLAPTWRFLQQRAHRGATVYWSYFAGDYDFHQGAWCHDFTALTGCRHRLRYGCVDLPDDLLRLTGEELAIELHTDVGSPFPRAHLPLEPLAGTDVLLRDQRGRPALTRARRGHGQVIFCSYPLEYYLAERAEANATSTAHQLYHLITREAGLTPAIACDQPWIQRRLIRDGDDLLLCLFNHAWQPLTASIDSPGGEVLYGAQHALTPGRQSLALEPKEMAIYRLLP